MFLENMMSSLISTGFYAFSTGFLRVTGEEPQKKIQGAEKHPKTQNNYILEIPHTVRKAMTPLKTPLLGGRPRSNMTLDGYKSLIFLGFPDMAWAPTINIPYRTCTGGSRSPIYIPTHVDVLVASKGLGDQMVPAFWDCKVFPSPQIVKHRFQISMAEAQGTRCSIWQGLKRINSRWGVANRRWKPTWSRRQRIVKVNDLSSKLKRIFP